MKTLLTIILSSLISLACWAADTVNVNTASAEEIAEGLKGVGATKAAAIIDYREENGRFEAPEDILKVPGIGSGTFEGIRDNISVR